tara:strand:+ start:576 stop:776 length:201 start_codon:yes stop_codon:yes gene_type:complete
MTTELTAEETLARLDQDGIKPCEPGQCIMVAGMIGNPAGNDIIEISSNDFDHTTKLDTTLSGPEFS